MSVVRITSRRRVQLARFGPDRHHVPHTSLSRASSCSTRFALGLPVLPHLVVHPQRCGLVDGHHHRLALEAAPEEVPDDVLRDRLQPVVAREEVVLPAQLPLQPFLLLLVEPGGLDQVVDVLVEVRDSPIAVPACGSRRRAAPSRRPRPTAGSHRSET